MDRSDSEYTGLELRYLIGNTPWKDPLLYVFWNTTEAALEQTVLLLQLQ